jgi:hypothetical protein
VSQPTRPPWSLTEIAPAALPSEDRFRYPIRISVSGLQKRSREYSIALARNRTPAAHTVARH